MMRTRPCKQPLTRPLERPRNLKAHAMPDMPCGAAGVNPEFATATLSPLEAIDLAARVPGPMADKAVLGELARCVNKAGESWPSNARMADRAGCSARTVRYALRRLEAAGLIKRRRRLAGGRGANGKGMTVIYWLDFEAMARAAGLAQPLAADATPAPGGGEPWQTYMVHSIEGGAGKDGAGAARRQRLPGKGGNGCRVKAATVAGEEDPTFEEDPTTPRTGARAREAVHMRRDPAFGGATLCRAIPKPVLKPDGTMLHDGTAESLEGTTCRKCIRLHNKREWSNRNRAA